MNIAVLSRKSKSYFITTLKETINNISDFSCQIEIIDPFNCQLYLENQRELLLYNGVPLKNFDVIISRINSSAIDYSVRILKYFEKAGIKIVNGSEVIEKCKNKFEMLQNLKKIKDVKIPKSILVKSPKELSIGVDIVGGFPVMLKMTSTEIKHLNSIMVNDLNYAMSFLDINFMLDNFTQIGQNIIVQEFVQGSFNRSINYVIIGQEIFSSYKNKETIINRLISDNTDNLYPIPIATKELIQSIAKSFKLDFGVISTLESGKEQLILKVNPYPDVEELEKVHKTDIFPQLIKNILLKTSI